VIRRLQILPVILAALAGIAPALGADPPTLKNTLGKVQSEAGSKAVEDLIGKLKGPARKPAAPQEPAVATPAPAPPAAPTISAPESKPADDTAAAEPTPAAEGATEHATPVEAASIDLEIFFPYKSSKIAPEAAATLEPLGRALADPRLAGDTFLIAGHTDAKGGADYNLALSRQRAEAVRQHLIANFGIAADRLVAKGMGLKQLKRPDDPMSAVNRRVQIVNLSKTEQR
jgi:outer membrane protein OmpA-like peptidoglycan-associated protein